MTALVGSFITSIAPYVMAGIIAIFGLLGYRRQVRKAAVNEQKLKEAEAREEHLSHIGTAAGAKPTGSVLDDPNNRDNLED